MAAAPPPYNSSPSGTPGGPGWDPRQQWKYQRRAQKEQWRNQRAYYRGMRRPSIARPVILIAIGILALLIQTNTINGYAFWDWYVRWWPLLLIGLGVLLLGEWWLQRDQPFAARSGVGGFVVLIVLVAIAGVAGKHAMNSPFGWHFTDDDDNNWSMHLFGQEHDADRQFDQAFGANGKLTIDNPRGDVSISASTDDRIHVSAHETVYTNNRDAEKQLSKLQPALQVNGNVASLTTASVDRGTVDLTVQVPADTSVSMNAGRGNIAVNGLNGTVGVNAGRGNVTLNKIAGACTARMSGGDFAAHALTSTLALSGRTEDASISDVAGRVTLDGDFLGDVNLSKLAAPLNFHSSKTTFEVDRLDGDLSLDGDDLNIENAKGRVQASTHAKNITFSGMSGPLDVDTSDGDINVELSGGNGTISLHNRNGAIHVGLPADHLFHVDANTQDGSVSSDLTFTGKVQRSDRSLSGDTGSGTGAATAVTLVAEHGDIDIKRAEAKEAPEAPEAPEVPEMPEGLHVPRVPKAPKLPKMPRLRVPQGTSPETSQQ